MPQHAAQRLGAARGKEALRCVPWLCRLCLTFKPQLGGRHEINLTRFTPQEHHATAEDRVLQIMVFHLTGVCPLPALLYRRLPYVLVLSLAHRLVQSLSCVRCTLQTFLADCDHEKPTSNTSSPPCSGNWVLIRITYGQTGQRSASTVAGHPGWPVHSALLNWYSGGCLHDDSTGSACAFKGCFRKSC